MSLHPLIPIVLARCYIAYQWVSNYRWPFNISLKFVKENGSWSVTFLPQLSHQCFDPFFIY